MIACPQCRAPNADDARFCGACGHATSMTDPQRALPGPGDAAAMLGREIAGRYRILAKLGEGGMGTVYRAEQLSLKRTVALKLLRPDVGDNAMLLRRFNAEAEAVAKLSHPNTVNIFDFGQDGDGTLFIAMEYIEGRSLRAAIHAEAPLPLRRALTIAAQVCASIADAHAHAIIHRDLKPDNVMLQARGKLRDVVRVLDFGIAKLRDDTRATHAMTQAGDMLGTPQYMAPEQIRAEVIDGRTDVYALGCMLYEMITARLPFEAPTVMALLSKHLLEEAPRPSHRRPELAIPPAIDELVMGAMAKAPHARPATMELFGEHLAAILATLPPDPYQPASAQVGVPYVSAGLPRVDTPVAPSAVGASPLGAAPFAPPTSPPPAGPAYTPAPYTPTPSAPGQPAPTLQVAPPPTGTRRALLVVLAVLLLGGGGLAAFLLARSSSAPAAVEADPAPAPAPTRRIDHWGTPAVDAAVRHPSHDPWARGSGTAPTPASPRLALAGEAIDVGQGARFQVPPGFVASQTAEGSVAMDATRGVFFAFAEIEDDTDDPAILAARYARETGLTLAGTSTTEIQGKARPYAIFEGEMDGTPVRHLVVAFIGAGYRLGMIVHVPQALGQDRALQELVTEAAERRLQLP